jgi:sugar lactone lactonase YvrE
VDGGSLSFTRLDRLAGKIGGGGASNSGAPGGPRVDAVYGVCSDGAGGFYITDTSSRTFSSMTTSGTLKRLAGIPYLSGGTDGPLGTSTFGQPRGCVVSGNVVYIADTFGDTIRAYDIMHGTLKTVVGSFLQYGSVPGMGASAKLAYPSQLAMYGSMLYAIDNGSSNLHIIDTSNFTVTNVGAAPGTMAWGTSTDGNNVMMSSPCGITVSSNGAELYIADTGNAVILQMDTAAPYTTILYAGIPGQHGNQPGALLNDGTLGTIEALAFSTDGATLFATDASWGLLELTSTMISTLLDSSFDGLAVLSSGDVIMGEPGIHAVDRVMQPSGVEMPVIQSSQQAGVANGSLDKATFTAPAGMRASGSTLYIADAGSHAIRTIIGQQVGTFAGDNSIGNADTAVQQASFNLPIDVAVGGDGTVYVADAAQRNIRAIANNMVTTLAGQMAFPPGPAGLVNLPGTAAQFDTPRSLVIVGETLYVSDAGNNNVIRTVDISNTPTRGAVGTVSIGNETQLHGCDPTAGLTFGGLASDEAKQVLYAAVPSQCRIDAIDLTTGTATVVAGGQFGAQTSSTNATAASFEAVGALAFDAEHTLFATDDVAALVVAVDLTAGTVSPVVGSANNHAVAIAPLPAQLNQSSGIALWRGVGLIISVAAESAILYAH